MWTCMRMRAFQAHSKEARALRSLNEHCLIISARVPYPGYPGTESMQSAFEQYREA